MQFRRESRQRDAVLAALATVGQSGMTPLALAVTIDLPEARLQAILERLVRAGLIARKLDRWLDGWAAAPRLCRPRYHLIATSKA